MEVIDQEFKYTLDKKVWVHFLDPLCQKVLEAWHGSVSPAQSRKAKI